MAFFIESAGGLPRREEVVRAAHAAHTAAQRGAQQWCQLPPQGETEKPSLGAQPPSPVKSPALQVLRTAQCDAAEGPDSAASAAVRRFRCGSAGTARPRPPLQPAAPGPGPLAPGGAPRPRPATARAAPQFASAPAAPPATPGAGQGASSAPAASLPPLAAAGGRTPGAARPPPAPRAARAAAECAPSLRPPLAQRQRPGMPPAYVMPPPPAPVRPITVQQTQPNTLSKLLTSFDPLAAEEAVRHEPREPEPWTKRKSQPPQQSEALAPPPRHPRPPGPRRWAAAGRQRRRPQQCRAWRLPPPPDRCSETYFVHQFRRLMWQVRVQRSLRSTTIAERLAAVWIVAVKSTLKAYFDPWANIASGSWSRKRDLVLRSRGLAERNRARHMLFTWKRLYGKLLVAMAMRRTVHGLYTVYLRRWRLWAPDARLRRLEAQFGSRMTEMRQEAEWILLRRVWRRSCWRALQRAERLRRLRLDTQRMAEMTLSFFSQLSGRRALELLFQVATDHFQGESMGLYQLEFLLRSEDREARITARRTVQAQRMAARVLNKQMRSRYRTWSLWANARATRRGHAQMARERRMQRALTRLGEISMRTSMLLLENYWRKMCTMPAHLQALRAQSEVRAINRRRRSTMIRPSVRPAVVAAALSGAVATWVTYRDAMDRLLTSCSAELVAMVVSAAGMAAAVSRERLLNPYCVCHGVDRITCRNLVRLAPSGVGKLNARGVP
eukprot:TRINITY_DN23466_c0_g1_i1.p1 TRINITY_DN23466_c0_g1~~TRINITY_DN23466_c0_g1_i1.p1  ORF type:complete len:725 (+),score=97.95 TRINITY_DN23466_c0_g1_i1:78-2252(+)